MFLDKKINLPILKEIKIIVELKFLCMENIVTSGLTETVKNIRQAQHYAFSCLLAKRRVSRFQKMKIIWKLEFNVVYPLDILDGLNAFLPQYLNRPLKITGSQIELFNIFDDKRGFLACCYAVLIDGCYYGVVAGSKNIFACPKEVYRFTAGEQITVAVSKKNGSLFELVGKYDKENLSICISRFQRRYLTALNCYENLIVFCNPVSFIEALYAAEKYIQKL